jgi:type I restriction enzyme M protein
MTGDGLLDFINNTLLPKLKNFSGTSRIHSLIRTAFEDANNYMKNGTLMRQVINKINGIDFNASDDRHMFGDIYEKLLKTFSPRAMQVNSTPRAPSLSSSSIR